MNIVFFFSCLELVNKFFHFNKPWSLLIDWIIINVQRWKSQIIKIEQLIKSRDFRQNYHCDFHLWERIKVLTFNPLIVVTVSSTRALTASSVKACPRREPGSALSTTTATPGAKTAQTGEQISKDDHAFLLLLELAVLSLC
jgi:hypothetical protein